MKKDIPIREKSLKVRFLSALTSVMILVMTIVPTLSVSATDINSLNGNSTTTDVDLLAGNGNFLADNANNAQDVISNADKTYLLGIASQFCLFLQNDFTPKDADAEGRVAVGGIVSFEGGYNYQIGQGDFATRNPIENLTNINGKHIYYKGAAHLITAGNYFERVNIKSEYTDNNNSDISIYKIFAVGEDFDIDKCSYLWENEYNQDYIYKSNLIDFNAEFQKLNVTTNKIAKQSTNGTAVWNDNTLELTCTDPSADVVYFNINTWNEDVNAINYIDIPDGAYMVVTCGDDTISIDGLNNKVETTINGDIISNQGGNNTNNNVNSERILYNFYNASTVYIDANFNGTILAPNADVTSDDACHGHLSGALIAKSFEGGLEFGYRPYQGSIDMLRGGLSYCVPLQKVDEDGNGLNNATFEVIDTDTGSVVATLNSTGNVDYIKIPSKVDFSGDTKYSAKDSVSASYLIREKSAPRGYEKTDLTISVDVLEGILAVDENGIPTETSANLDVYSSDETVFAMSTITSIKDTYNSDDKLTNRKITLEDASFNIGFNDNGSVSSITDDGFSVGIESFDKSCTFEYAGQTYIYDAESFMIMPNIDVTTFTNKEAGALVKLQKIDQDGNNLNGAIVDIYDDNDTKVASNVLLDMTSNEPVDMATIMGRKFVPEGIYYLVETKAPAGASITTDKQYFEVVKGSDGVYTIQKYIITQDLNDFIIKQSWGWQYQDFSGINNKDIDSIDVTTSGSGTTSIQVMANNWKNTCYDGDITLGETINIPIDGSLSHIQGNNDAIDKFDKIIVNYKDGSSVVLFASKIEPNINIDGNVVKLINDVSTDTFDATISKVDVSNGSKELEGATLTITSKDGKDLSSV
ncbi:MAG: choice-of-anchor A family protein, partial [Ruminococcus sp.]|nr:choice-of-anchor A family protein [Ruminococcus sp.]